MELKDVAAGSETAALHEKTLYKVFQELQPKLLWAQFHIIRELITGLANLKQIISECRKGRLSTNETAELIGDWSLSEIHPEITQISRVEVDKNNHVFKMWFKIPREKDDATRSLGT